METSQQTTTDFGIDIYRKKISEEVPFDLNEYACELRRMTDLRRDQSEEFLKALFAIMVAFVDIGFGIHPTQRASKSSDSSDDLLVVIEELVKRDA